MGSQKQGTYSSDIEKEARGVICMHGSGRPFPGLDGVYDFGFFWVVVVVVVLYPLSLMVC